MEVIGIRSIRRDIEAKGRTPFACRCGTTFRLAFYDNWGDPSSTSGTMPRATMSDKQQRIITNANTNPKLTENLKKKRVT